MCLPHLECVMFIMEQVHHLFDELDEYYLLECYAMCEYTFDSECVSILLGA
jgi:hypothetical protein